MKKKKTTIPSIIKWVIALILVVMQVYPFFYVCLLYTSPSPRDA